VAHGPAGGAGGRTGGRNGWRVDGWTVAQGGGGGERRFVDEDAPTSAVADICSVPLYSQALSMSELCKVIQSCFGSTWGPIASTLSRQSESVRVPQALRAWQRLALWLPRSVTSSMVLRPRSSVKSAEKWARFERSIYAGRLVRKFSDLQLCASAKPATQAPAGLGLARATVG